MTDLQILQHTDIAQELYKSERDLEQFINDNEPKEGEPERIALASILTALAAAKALLVVMPEIRKLFTNKKTGAYAKPKIWKFGQIIKIIATLLVEFIKAKLAI